MVTPGVLVALLVVLVAFFILHRTRTGRLVFAIGGSEQSAQLMGLPVHRTKMWVYVITGIGWELDAIAATVIGGILLVFVLLQRAVLARRSQ